MTETNPLDLVSEVHQGAEGYVEGNHWAIPYLSNHSFLNKENLRLLEHVNCSYLSTPGRPPTLLALKQHAQSLAVLISRINPSREAGEIDNVNAGGAGAKRAFTKDEAFDWLNNLLTHYDTLDKDHHRPLNSLVNLVRSNSDIEGVQYHCPLDTIPIEFAENNPDYQYRPFENHLTLLMHANDCLERLDHEYSALGGVLSIIPTDSDEANESEALKGAKQTLIGQWILYTQHLVARMHELEINYGNMQDLLANEAIVPAQHNSVHGPDGRSGREIVFPQDRWILANAGEDVFNLIHQMLDKKEAAVERADRVHEDHGVVGGALYTEERTRGIVSVDLSSRFYRIKGSGHGPLFVLPAFGDRPSTQHTRDMESRPAVVCIPTPGNPERVSAWDNKHRNIEANEFQFAQVAELRRDVAEMADKLQRQVEETEQQRAIVQAYEEAQSGGGDEAKAMSNQLKKMQAEKAQANDNVTSLGKQVVELENEVATYKQQMADMYRRIPALAPTNANQNPANPAQG